MKQITRTLAAALLLLLLGTSAQAALQARDLNGDTVTDAYYDTELDITWLRDWSAAAGSAFDDGSSTTDGAMTWDNANAWANALVFGGFSDWRLPTMVDTGSAGCDYSFAGGTDCGYSVQTKTGTTVFSEMAHLYYVTLGSEAYCLAGDATCSVFGNAAGWHGDPQEDYAVANGGLKPFSYIQSGRYWSGLEYLSTPSGAAWDFSLTFGHQHPNTDYQEQYAVAVRTGDVAASVSEPQALALTLLAIAAAATSRRRRPR